MQPQENYEREHQDGYERDFQKTFEDFIAAYFVKDDPAQICVKAQVVSYDSINPFVHLLHGTTKTIEPYHRLFSYVEGAFYDKALLMSKLMRVRAGRFLPDGHVYFERQNVWDGMIQLLNGEQFCEGPHNNPMPELPTKEFEFLGVEMNDGKPKSVRMLTWWLHQNGFNSENALIQGGIKRELIKQIIKSLGLSSIKTANHKNISLWYYALLMKASKMPERVEMAIYVYRFADSFPRNIGGKSTPDLTWIFRHIWNAMSANRVETPMLIEEGKAPEKAKAPEEKPLKRPAHGMPPVRRNNPPSEYNLETEAKSQFGLSLQIVDGKMYVPMSDLQIGDAFKMEDEFGTRGLYMKCATPLEDNGVCIVKVTTGELYLNVDASGIVEAARTERMKILP